MRVDRLVTNWRQPVSSPRFSANLANVEASRIAAGLDSLGQTARRTGESQAIELLQRRSFVSFYPTVAANQDLSVAVHIASTDGLQVLLSWDCTYQPLLLLAPAQFRLFVGGVERARLASGYAKRQYGALPISLAWGFKPEPAEVGRTLVIVVKGSFALVGSNAVVEAR